MDEVKIRNFERERPGEAFPRYRTLSSDEAKPVETNVRLLMGLPPDTSSLDLVSSIREASDVLPAVHAEADCFDLQSVFDGIGVSPGEQVYINWNRFDHVDQIGLNDLIRYFDDIWYPAVDHIELFDDTFRWMLSVGYSGVVSIIRHKQGS